jgi:hypothetical protein
VSLKSRILWNMSDSAAVTYAGTRQLVARRCRHVVGGVATVAAMPARSVSNFFNAARYRNTACIALAAADASALLLSCFLRKDSTWTAQRTSASPQ